MKLKNLLPGLLAACLIPGFLTAEPAEPGAHDKSETAVEEKVQSTAEDTAKDKRKKILEEAVTALAETKKAVTALDEGNTDDALKSLEKATGKLEIIIARDPDLSLAAVDVAITTYDLYASLDTIKSAKKRVIEHLKDNDVQAARSLLNGLASEIVISTTHLPLATYPDAIKAAVALIDDGQTEDALATLQTALNTLIVTEEVIPLPILRAEMFLLNAESMAENDERTEEDNKTLADLLDSARKQIRMAQSLGYGDDEIYNTLLDQITEIEQKTMGGKSGKGFFDKIKETLGDLRANVLD